MRCGRGWGGVDEGAEVVLMMDGDRLVVTLFVCLLISFSIFF